MLHIIWWNSCPISYAKKGSVFSYHEKTQEDYPPAERGLNRNRLLGLIHKWVLGPSHYKTQHAAMHSQKYMVVPIKIHGYT